jgi:hypothetical protein
MPQRIEVDVGEHDWQAGPKARVRFCNATSIEVYLVPQRGHMPGADYDGPLLDRWLIAAQDFDFDTARTEREALAG